MLDSERYFAAEEPSKQHGEGKWVTWSSIEPIEMLEGLNFQPVLGDKVMVNFVALDPHTVAPMHWHEEEQITFVIDGEFEFTVGEETKLMKRGDSVVIPPNVPHGARTLDSSCLEVDVFHPPRRGLLEAMGLADNEE